MSLDKDTVRKIAILARIRVPAEALDGLSGELSNIIGWVEQLNEVDTKGVDPMTSVADMDWPRRDDEITDGGRAADKPASFLPWNLPEARLAELQISTRVDTDNTS